MGPAVVGVGVAGATTAVGVRVRAGFGGTIVCEIVRWDVAVCGKVAVGVGVVVIVAEAVSEFVSAFVADSVDSSVRVGHLSSMVSWLEVYVGNNIAGLNI